VTVRIRELAALLTALSASLAGAAAAAERPVERSFAHDGATRSYILQVPAAARATGRVPPALIVLHGGGGNARQMQRFSRFDELAAREGFVAFYPQGIDRGWNDSREFRGRDSHKDDVGFLIAMLDDARRAGVAFDRAAVFATGISNGGFMAMRLACEAAPHIAGIAAVTATMPAEIGGRCRPARPVSAMIINGTADPLVPYGGGFVRAFGRDRGAIWSTDRTVQFFAALNGCDGAPRATPLPDRDAGDGTTTIRFDYRGCRRAPVALLQVQGGGHTWPGGLQYLPVALIGPVARDFDASEAIWDFFKSVRR
jgi:polyhydroxybutyrate depolymerase